MDLKNRIEINKLLSEINNGIKNVDTFLSKDNKEIKSNSQNFYIQLKKIYDLLNAIDIQSLSEYDSFLPLISDIHRYYFLSINNNDKKTDDDLRSSVSSASSVSSTAIKSSMNDGDNVRQIMPFALSSTSTSLLTEDNVNIYTIWQSICFLIDKYIKNELVSNVLENRLLIEKYRYHFNFIYKIKVDNDFIKFYNDIRIEKIENYLKYNDNVSIENLMKLFLKLINNEVNLLTNKLFNVSVLSLEEMFTIYLRYLKEYIENKYSKLKKENVKEIIDLINEMKLFTIKINNLRKRFHSVKDYYENENELNWKWKEYFHIIGYENILIRDLNERLLSFIKLYDNIDLNQNKLIKFNNEFILNEIENIFSIIKYYDFIDLNGFQKTKSILINSMVIDFIIEKINLNKLNSINDLYIILNSLYYSREKLKSYSICNEKIYLFINEYENEIIIKNFQLICECKDNFEFFILFMKKLFFTLNKYLLYANDYEINKLYRLLIEYYFQHFAKFSYTSIDNIKFMLANSIDLILPICENSSSKYFQNELKMINNYCFMIICKYIFNVITLDDLCDAIENNIENNERKLSIEHFNSSGNLNQTVCTNVFNLFDLNQFYQNAFTSAYICSVKYRQPRKSLIIISPFLERKYYFTIKVLTSNEIMENLCFAQKLCLSIFKIIILYESQPNALAYVILAITQRWSEEPFRVPLLKESSNIWWFNAIISLFDETVSNILDELIPSLLFNTSVCQVSKTNELILISSTLGCSFLDKQLNINKCIEAILKEISTILISVSSQLISSLKYLGNFILNLSDLTFQSLPIHIIFISIINYIDNCDILKNMIDKNISNSNDDNNNIGQYLKENLIERIVMLSKNTIDDDYSQLMEFNINFLNELVNDGNNIIASEDNQISLISSQIDEHFDMYEETINFLFKFLCFNTKWINDHRLFNKSDNKLNLNYEMNTNENKHLFNVFEVHRAVKQEIIFDQISMKLNDINSLLDNIVKNLSSKSIEYLLRNNENFMSNVSERIKKIKFIYGLVL